MKEVKSWNGLATFDWWRFLGRLGGKPKDSNENKLRFWRDIQTKGSRVIYAKGSVQEAAQELSIDSGRITK